MVVGSQPMLPALQVIELKMQCVQDAALWLENTAMQVVLQLMECEGWIYVSRKHNNCSDEEVGIYA
jgi:hypothetical protein